jgi:putative endonuclease
MYYVYVLRSAKDDNFYTGSTGDLRKRLTQHNDGAVRSTKGRRPLMLVYYEACISEADTRKREKYLKTAWGKRYLKSRLRNYLTG